MAKSLLHVPLLILGISLGTVWSCPGDSITISTSPAEKTKQIKSLPVEKLDESCFSALLEKLQPATDTATPDLALSIIERWTGRNGFSIPLFRQCAGMDFVAQRRECGNRLARAWERKNGPVMGVIGRLDAAGERGSEDSLFSAFDQCRSLAGDQLLRWAHLREVVGGYTGAAAVYGKALAADRRFCNTVFMKMYELLENSSGDTIASALAAFRRETVPCQGGDTAGIQTWIAGFYCSHGMDGEALSVLTEVPATMARLAPGIFGIARQRFEGGRYAGAIAPAKTVYEHCDDQQLKTATADILYIAYQRLGDVDSALLWIRRTGMAGERRSVDAAVLYQEAGRLPEAKAIISALHPSLSRDTLAVRQLLWSGDTGGAVRAMSRRKDGQWALHPDEWLLWRSRVLLFDGTLGELSALLDSNEVPASWHGAQEVLNDRYLLQLFGQWAEALRVWPEVEYDLFRGKSDEARTRVAGAELRPEPRGALVLRIVNDLLRRGGAAAAEKVFAEQGEPLDLPEYLYCYAETLVAAGKADRAQALLLRIVRDFPGTIFTEKARVLLAKLRGPA